MDEKGKGQAVKMPDGNSAALRKHEAAQDRAEALYDSYGERVVQSIIDDLFNLEKVGKVTLHDFCESIGSEEIVAALKGNTEPMRKTVENDIRSWCDEDRSGEVAERIRNWEESDRDNA